MAKKIFDKLNSDQLLREIKNLKSQIISINKSGEVAPEGCEIIAYKAKGKGGYYDYFKVESKKPIFLAEISLIPIVRLLPLLIKLSKFDCKKLICVKFTKYQHLGKPNTLRVLGWTLAITREKQIKALEKAIDSLRICRSITDTHH